MIQPDKRGTAQSVPEEKAMLTENSHPWINPVGGLGDMLMLGGILKQLNDKNPSSKFNLLRRTRYVELFQGHPAIETIGYPSPEDKILHTTYWSMEALGRGEQRAYQVLARHFGLDTPAEEILYLPAIPEEDPLLDNLIPWKATNLLIAPASDSPRKTIHPSIWHQLTDRFLSNGFFVAQAGLINEIHIRNTYSLLGLTDPRQLLRMAAKFDLIITADNFIMHAAHMHASPAVVIWGPTQHEVYGYPEHVHIQRYPTCGLDPGQSCLASDQNEGGKIYGTPCPLKENNCMAEISADEIYRECIKVLGKIHPTAKAKT